jgi:hypothetical protein
MKNVKNQDIEQKAQKAQKAQKDTLKKLLAVGWKKLDIVEVLEREDEYALIHKNGDVEVR